MWEWQRRLLSAGKVWGIPPYPRARLPLFCSYLIYYIDIPPPPILACDSSDPFSLTYFFLSLQRPATLVRTLIYNLPATSLLDRRLSLCSD